MVDDGAFLGRGAMVGIDLYFIGPRNAVRIVAGGARAIQSVALGVARLTITAPRLVTAGVRGAISGLGRLAARLAA